LIVNPVDEPTWENVGQEASKVFKRRAISFLVTFSLWVASKKISFSNITHIKLGAVIIIALTFDKNPVNKKSPTINCKNENPTNKKY